MKASTYHAISSRTPTTTYNTSVASMPSNEDFHYEADIVPAIQLSVDGETQFYVPKQPKQYHKDLDKLWRRSYPQEERDIMSRLDQDGGCRKQCIRSLKAIRDLLGLTATCTYHIKTLVMNMARDNTSSEYWSQENFGICFTDCLLKLSTTLRRSDLRHHFEPKMNLLSTGRCSLSRKDQDDQIFDSFHIQKYLTNEESLLELLAYRANVPFDSVQKEKNEITGQFWRDYDFGINGPPEPGWSLTGPIKDNIGQHNFEEEYLKMKLHIFKILDDRFPTKL